MENKKMNKKTSEFLFIQVNIGFGSSLYACHITSLTVNLLPVIADSIQLKHQQHDVKFFKMSYFNGTFFSFLHISQLLLRAPSRCP